MSATAAVQPHRHHVARARRSLQQLAHDVQFAPDEREYFADDVADLRAALHRLEQGCLTIAMFGTVGRGKSAVANALLDRDDFAMAPIHGTTRSPQRARRTPAATDSESAPDCIRRIEILDLPGLNDVDGAARDRLARQAARQADLIVFVLAGDMTAIEHQALVELRRVNKPLVLAFNKIDLYPDRDRQAIYASLTDPKLQEFINPDEIALVAARPKPAPIEVRWPDGRSETTWAHPEPDVADLEAKLQQTIARDGPALLALNALLFADDWRDRVVKKKMRLRDVRAQAAIWRYAGWKAIAVALNPIPGLDILGSVAVDLGMMTAVARQYGLGLPRSAALVKQGLAGWGGVALVELVTSVGWTPGAAVGAIANGGAVSYGATACVQAAVAGLTAYLLGQATRTALQQGDRLNTDSPKQVLRSLLGSLKPHSALYRLQHDIGLAAGVAAQRRTARPPQRSSPGRAKAGRDSTL